MGLLTGKKNMAKSRGDCVVGKHIKLITRGTPEFRRLQDRVAVNLNILGFERVRRIKVLCDLGMNREAFDELKRCLPGQVYRAETLREISNPGRFLSERE